MRLTNKDGVVSILRLLVLEFGQDYFLEFLVALDCLLQINHLTASKFFKIILWDSKGLVRDDFSEQTVDSFFLTVSILFFLF